MDSSLTYLDTYILQQDMRIRMPKSILSNMNIEKGQTFFEIYLNQDKDEIILKVSKKRKGDCRDDK